MRPIALAGVLLTAAPLVVGVEGIDLHRLWDDRCAECHGHAGAFARRSLVVADGELQGRHHVHDLRRFLANHYLAKSEVDAVYRMLLAQASTPARFKEECSGCHGNASDFVRESLVLRAGVLVGRESGQPVREYLDGHRDLSPEDAEFFTGVLTRVAGEVFRP